MTEQAPKRTTLQCALVGMHFRPPARQVLARLRVGTLLELIREPENPYDPAAVQVWVAPSALPEELWQDPGWEEELAQAGSGVEDLWAQERLQLGYLGQSPKLIEPGQTPGAKVAERMDAGERVEAKLTYSLSGKPSVGVRVEG